MKVLPVLAAAVILLAATTPPAPISGPTSAQVVKVQGSTIILRTDSGQVVGIDVPPAQLQAAHVHVGTRAKLVPLPQGNVRVILGPQAQQDPNGRG